MQLTSVATIFHEERFEAAVQGVCHQRPADWELSPAAGGIPDGRAQIVRDLATAPYLALLDGEVMWEANKPANRHLDSPRVTLALGRRPVANSHPEG
jgi:hypothetical protein